MIPSIQLLRAFAALSVVFFHAQAVINSKTGSNYLFTPFAASGVDIFFVISGFIMMYVSYNRFETDRASTKFIKNRFLRIAPIYYLITSITVIVLIVFPSVYGTLRFDLKHVIFSYLFILSENNVGTVGTVVGVGWSLAIEAFFYLIFAIMLNFNRKYFLPTLTIIFLIGSMSGLVFNIPYAWAKVFTNTYLFEFLLGCIIAKMYHNGLQLNKKISASLIIIGLIWICAAVKLEMIDQIFDYRHIFAFGISAAFIVSGLIFLEKKVNLRMPKFLLTVGNGSYSLYLIHQQTIMVFSLIITPILIKMNVPAIIIFIMLIATCLISGLLCYFVFEKPITGLKKDKRTALNPLYKSIDEVQYGSE